MQNKMESTEERAWIQQEGDAVKWQLIQSKNLRFYTASVETVTTSARWEDVIRIVTSVEMPL